MSNRTERREAERAARKAAQRELRHQNAAQTTPLTEAEAVGPQTISEAQLAANRANAQLSTGAATPEGKAVSARNHTTHGLTAEPIGPFKVLPTENQAEFDALLASFVAEWQPSTPTEHDLVHRYVIHSWLADRAYVYQNQVLADAHGNALEVDAKYFNLFARYLAFHERGCAKMLSSLMRLRAFKLREEKQAAALEIRALTTQARLQNGFESQQQKAELHAAKMELLNLKMEAQRQRNTHTPKVKNASQPAPEIAETPLQAAA